MFPNVVDSSQTVVNGSKSFQFYTWVLRNAISWGRCTIPVGTYPTCEDGGPRRVSIPHWARRCRVSTMTGRELRGRRDRCPFRGTNSHKEYGVTRRPGARMSPQYSRGVATALTSSLWGASHPALRLVAIWRDSLMAMLFRFSVQECAQLEAKLRVLGGNKELLFAVQ